jgi:hypothetical protein
MRILSLIVIILGIAAIVFGVLFVMEAGSGQKEIEESIAPLTIDKVSDTYDMVKAQLAQVPQTDPNYLPTSLQKTSLGLAKANIGAVKNARMSGYVNMGVGLAFILTGIVCFGKRSD